MAARDPVTGLTPQQEAFAQLLASPAPISQHAAYLQAGYSSNSLPSTIDEEASRLANTPKILARIQQLKTAAQAKVVAKHSWNLDRIVTQAEKHVDIALTGGFKGVPAANGALELIGRVTGLLSDKAREPQQQPITRVVIVLNHGQDPHGRPRIIEEAAYEVLPPAVEGEGSPLEDAGEADNPQD